MIRISVDVMGGDYGPEAAIAGAAIVQKYFPNIYFLFYGVDDAVKPVLKNTLV